MNANKFMSFEVVLMGELLDGDHGTYIKKYTDIVTVEDLNLLRLFWSVNGVLSSSDTVSLASMKYEEKEKAKDLMYLLIDMNESKNRLEAVTNAVSAQLNLADTKSGVLASWTSDVLSGILSVANKRQDS